MSITKRHPTTLALGAALVSAVATTGCSSVGDFLSGDKVDYRSSGAQTVKLDVPPDLSQLPGQTRYGQVTASTVSASSLMRADKADANVVLPQSTTVKLERQGQTRWLSVNLPPEAVAEQVRSFWLDMGFELTTDKADLGLFETNFNENRAKVPQDGVRKALGKVFEALYDTGERDQYRTRIERTAGGCEVYITHRGLSEEFEDAKKERTTWKVRPSDPGLEAEMLSRLMVKLGAPKDAATAAKAVAAAPVAANTALARLDASGVNLSVDADFDTAWRRVGLALDRSGFTVENRDRKNGNYEVRLSDSDVEANKPGFFKRLFSSSAASYDGLSRYNVKVVGQSRSNTLVSVTDDKGNTSKSDTAKRIAKQLLDELN
jgi:outer membrane protein assembly factor BamC